MQHINKKLQLLAAVALSLTLTYFLLLPSKQDDDDVARWHMTVLSTQPHANITQEVEILQTLKVPSKFHYRRYCIDVKQSESLFRETLYEVPGSFPSEADADEIKLDGGHVPTPDAESVLPPCQDGIVLEVPAFEAEAAANTKALTLGVATTLSRIESSLPAFSRWLSGTGSPLIVLLVDQPKLRDVRPDLERIRDKYAESKINVIFEPYRGSVDKDSEGLKNFALAEVFNKHRHNHTQWFGIIDDDTFFLSLPRVLEVLADYPHEEPLYLGALTEGHSRVSREGFKAWGGAGFFISPPLMETLARNALYCRELEQQFGDLLWRDCIFETTSPTVGLTELPGLNQLDLWGDIAGWYEGPHETILSVHHWKSWHSYQVPNAHEVASVAGPDVFLQRYLFEKNIVFTNGYSIVEYPHGLPNLDFTELTFADDVGANDPPGKLEFHHSLGQTRPALQKGKDKISWNFELSINIHDTVRQFYVKRADADKEVSIIEVDWRRA